MERIRTQDHCLILIIGKIRVNKLNLDKIEILLIRRKSHTRKGRLTAGNAPGCPTVIGYAGDGCDEKHFCTIFANYASVVLLELIGYSNSYPCLDYILS